MSDTFRFVITEHAAWRITGQGSYRVFALPDGGQWLVPVHGGEPLSRPLVAGSDQPRLDVFRLPESAMAAKPRSCLRH